MRDTALRILHVTGTMNRGGAETWLMHVLRHIDRRRFHMDFLVHTAAEPDYADEIRALGSRLLVCPQYRSPWVYGRTLNRMLQAGPRYDILHSHVHFFSGVTAWAGAQAGIPSRIVHSHNDTSREQAACGWRRKLYYRMMRAAIHRYATDLVACSGSAGMALFGPREACRRPYPILHCAVGLSPFHSERNREAVRREWNIPPDALVMGHVARFEESKNHLFLIEVAREAMRRQPNFCLLLVGEGSLRRAVERRAAECGIAGRVRFAGLRPDIPRILMGAMDLVVFPSLYEGLPLALLEAQAAGLRCFISDVITQEVDVVKPLMRRLSLAEPAARWAAAISEGMRGPAPVSQTEALELLERSSFNIEVGVRRLERLYAEAAERGARVPAVDGAENAGGIPSCG